MFTLTSWFVFYEYFLNKMRQIASGCLKNPGQWRGGGSLGAIYTGEFDAIDVLNETHLYGGYQH